LDIKSERNRINPLLIAQLWIIVGMIIGVIGCTILPETPETLFTSQFINNGLEKCSKGPNPVWCYGYWNDEPIVVHKEWGGQ